MSRGPGSMQRAILSALEENGGWEYAANLAIDLPGAWSRAKEVSVLRAVRSLTRAGKLHSASICVAAQHGRRKYVLCGLPGQ